MVFIFYLKSLLKFANILLRNDVCSQLSYLTIMSMFENNNNNNDKHQYKITFIIEKEKDKPEMFITI